MPSDIAVKISLMLDNGDYIGAMKEIESENRKLPQNVNQMVSSINDTAKNLRLTLRTKVEDWEKAGVKKEIQDFVDKSQSEIDRIILKMKVDPSSVTGLERETVKSFGVLKKQADGLDNVFQKAGDRVRSYFQSDFLMNNIFLAGAQLAGKFFNFVADGMKKIIEKNTEARLSYGALNLMINDMQTGMASAVLKGLAPMVEWINKNINQVNVLKTVSEELSKIEKSYLETTTQLNEAKSKGNLLLVEEAELKRKQLRSDLLQTLDKANLSDSASYYLVGQRILSDPNTNPNEMNETGKIAVKTYTTIEETLNRIARMRKEGIISDKDLESIKGLDLYSGTLARKIKAASDEGKNLKAAITLNPSNYQDMTEYTERLKASMKQYGETLTGSYVSGNEAAVTYGDTQKTIGETQDKINASIKDIGGFLGDSPVAKEFEAAANSALNLIGNLQQIATGLQVAQAAGASFQLSMGNIVAIAGLVVSVFDNIKKALDANFNKSEDLKESQLGIEKIIAKYKKGLEDIGYQLEAIDLLIDRENISRTKTVDSLQTEIDLLEQKKDKTKDTIRLNNDYINSTLIGSEAILNQVDNIFRYQRGFIQFTAEQRVIVNQLIAEAKASGKSIFDILDSWKTAIATAKDKQVDNIGLENELLEIDQLIADKSYELLVLNNKNTIATEERKEALADVLGNEIDVQSSIEAQIEAYNEILDVTTDLNEQLDLKLKIAQLETKQLEKQKGLTNDILDNYIKAGLLDVQNLSQSQNAIIALQESGLRGIDLLSSINQYGFANPGRGNIETVNIIVNEATDGTVDRAASGRLASLVGGR